MNDLDMASKIKELRLARGLTLEQVGNAVGVGKSTVRKWETGIIANMRRDKIAKLADVLCVSPGYLMGWTDEPNPDSISESKRQLIELIPSLSEQEVEAFKMLAKAVLDKRGQ